MYNLVVMVTAIAATLLGVGWLFFGTAMLKRWGIQANLMV